jgi:DNA-directed RNA polymerase specialized sigma24 family protein
METSVPTCEEEVFGMTWSQIFTLRNTIAHQFHRRFHQSVPLEELLSAGNEAIAHTLQTYKPRMTETSYRAYLVTALVYASRRAWREEHRGLLAYQTTPEGTRKVSRTATQFVTLEQVALPRAVPYEARHDVQRLLASLPLLTSARERAIFAAYLAGETTTALGRTYGYHPTGIGVIVHRVRHRLQRWASHGLPGGLYGVRTTWHMLTPQERQTALRWHRAGMSPRAIARRLGCARGAIMRMVPAPSPVA